MTDYTPIDVFAFRTRKFDDPDEQPTWGDYGKELLATGQSVAASAKEASSYLAGKRGAGALADLQTLEAQQWRASADETRDSRSDAAKLASGSSPLEGEFWKHPLRATALKVTSSIPYVAAMAVPAGIAGAALGAVAGMATGTAVSGYLGAGNLLSDVMERIDDADDASLKRDSTYYAGLRDRLPEDEARREFRDFMAEGDGRLAIAALAEAAQGVLGVGGMAARAAAGRTAVLGAGQRGLAGRMGIGAATESGVEGFQESISNVTKQQSLIAGELQKEFSLQDWANSAVEGMLLGGIFGAGFGIPGGRRRDTPPGAPPAPATDINEDQAAALAAAAGPGTTPLTPPATPPAPQPGVSADVPADVAAAMAPATTNDPVPDGAAAGIAPEARQKLDGSEPTVPEPKATISAQLEDLKAGVRAVVEIPKGTTVPKKPKGAKYTQVGGVGVFYHSPEVSSEQIRTAVKEGRINELLNMGPTSKAQAVEDIAAGAAPAAVVVRKPDGIPVVEAASSSATAQQDAAVMREKAATGDTIEIGTPEAQIAERGMRARAEDNPRGNQTLQQIAERTARLDGAPGAVLLDMTPVEQMPRIIREVVEHAKEKASTADQQDENAEPRQKNKITDDFKTDEKPFFRRMQKIVDGEAAGDKQSAEAALKLRSKRGAAKRADKPKATEQIRMFQQAEYEARRAAEAQKEPAAPKKIGRPKKEALEATADDTRDEVEAALLRLFGKYLAVAGKATYGSGGTTGATIRGSDDKDKASFARQIKSLDVGGLRALGEQLYTQMQELTSDVTRLDTDARGSGGLSGGEIQTDIFKEIRTGASNSDIDTVIGDESGADRQELTDQLAAEPEAAADLDGGNSVAVRADQKAERTTSEETERTAAEPEVKQEDVKSKIDARRGEEIPTGVFTPKAAKIVEVANRRRKIASVPKPAGKVSLGRKSKGPEQAASELDNDLVLQRPEGQIFPNVNRTRTTMPGSIEVIGQKTGTRHADTPIQSLKLGALFDRMLSPGYQITDIIGRMFERRMRTLVGSLQVHLIDKNSPVLWSEAHNGYLDGFYDPVADHIVLSSDLLGDELNGRAILIHEAVHAAYAHKLESDPKARRSLEFLLEAARMDFRAKAGERAELPYGLTDIHELLAEAMSNPQFQAALASVEISSDTRNRLIARLGPSARSIRTLWDMFVQLLRKALGVTPAEYTALDAVLRVAQYLDNKVAAEGRLLSASDLAALQAKARTPDRDGVSGLASDRMNAFSDKFARGLIKFSAMNQLAQRFESTVIGPAIRQIDGAVSSVGNGIRLLKAAGDRIAVHGVDLERKYPEKYAELVDLMQQARMHEISMEGKNDFGADDSANWQAKKLFPQLKAQFDALPTELRQYYRDSASYYRTTHERVVKSSVDGVLEDLVLKNKLTDAERAGLTRRVMDQEMTEADKQLLGETVFEALENASAFHRVKGDYFPLMRFGDFVVVTNDTIKDTKGGRVVGADEDTVEFSGATQAAARRSAKAFAEASPLRQVGRAKKVYYDKLTDKQVTADEASGLNDVEIRFQVKLQTRGVYFFDSGTQAHEFVRTNPEGHDTIDPPEKRLGSGYRAHNFTGTQISALERHIDQRSDIASGQKQLLKSVIAQSSIMMASGNRVSTRRLKAQKVVGASKDHNRSLLQYNEAVARHIATAETMPLIRTSLREMQGTLENYAGKDRGWLRDAEQEVIARVDQGVYEPNESPQFVKNALTVSSLTRLFSPAYSVIQMVQPWMTTLPYLGGRFGMARTTLAMNKAYSQIGLGSVFRSGFGNTITAVKDFNDVALLKADDVVGDIRKRISGDKDLTTMLDYLIKHGAVDVNAGIEVAPSAMEGRSAGGRVLAGFDRVARQMPQVIEAVNRSVTGIAAYKLAREAGYPHDKATRYAFDAVKNTQGDYSAANQPRFFNNKWLRPAMQFRKYAQFMTWVMVDQFRRAFRDQSLSPEEKAVARRILRNYIAVQIAVAGSLSLPGLELIKVGFLAASVLGFGGGWDEAEEYLKKVADDTFGKGLGQMVTSGVITRLGGYGLDVSQRLSMADMWLFGEPRKNDAEGLIAYAGRLMFGSAGVYVASVAEGVQDLGNGKMEAGLGKILPMKFAADTAKAIGRYNKDEAGVGQVVTNAIGFQTAGQAERNRERGVLARANATREKEFRRLREQFYDAKKPADRAKAISRNREWNKTAPLRFKLPVRYNDMRRVN
jgi:hypothetical protein